jgi:hypothetical protein
LRDEGVGQLNGTIQCISTLNSIVNSYDRCVRNAGVDPTVGSPGCARNAARNIKQFACAYCGC